MQLVVVAYARSTGGRVRLLLAVEQDGQRLHEGEPVLLVEHHPAQPGSSVAVEGADVLEVDVVEHVAAVAGPAIVTLVDDAFDETGAWAPERILGKSIELPPHLPRSQP